LEGEKDRGLGQVVFESVLPLGEAGNSFNLSWATATTAAPPPGAAAPAATGPEKVELRCMTSEGRRNASDDDFKTRKKWIAALKAGGVRHEMDRVEEPTESGGGGARAGGGRRKRTRRKRTGRKRTGRKRTGRKRKSKRKSTRRKSTRRKSALRKSGLKRR
jgi:hypothetical protein